MNQKRFILELENATPEQTAIYLHELRESILDSAADIEVNKYRHASSRQEFFSGLSIILGTEAIIVLAKAIGDWLKLRQSAAVVFKTPEGNVVAQNLSSKQAVALIEKILEKIPDKNI